MDDKIKTFLSQLKGDFEMSQEVTMGLITGDVTDPLWMKIEARKEVIGDVLDDLNLVGLITDKEALKWADKFGVEI